MRAGGWMMRTGIVAALCVGAMATAALIPAPEPARSTAPAKAAPAPKPRVAPVAAPAPVPAAALPPAAPALEAMTVKRILDIPGPISFGTYYWNTDGVPADGALVITVDLEAQTMSVFRDGYEIGATAILYGMDEKPTPLGVHEIKQKKVHHISNLYGAPMPYMMRLTWDGVAIHGSEVEEGRATHGCIGVPTAFAKLVFAQAKLGDKVIITRGKRLGMGGVVTPE
ncbi:L,D-transpeptidase family protein [Sphingomonas sp.]|uniref:L,D-transpeptidase family protein n=1 Tax=Sphingomonas sp. TaxID=28214 RepID=UPI002E15689C|nr:L,D-transpeptidase family protein [Sphingomonas sp.]HEV7287656.1 L,D-transpeptidase family protein [Sphingomonas sp.]